MNLIRVFILLVCVLTSTSTSAQRDERDVKNAPPDNSYFSKGSASSSGKSGNSSYQIKRYTTWEMLALGRGALVVGQYVRFGKSRFGLTADLGINILNDRAEYLKADILQADYGYSSLHQVGLGGIIRYGEKSDGRVGLYVQLGLTIDTKRANEGWEIGVRVIKKEMDVDVNEFSYNNSISTYSGTLNNVFLKTINPYIAFREISSGNKSNFVNSVRLGLGLRFFQYQSCYTKEIVNEQGSSEFEFQKLGTRRSYGTHVSVMISLGIGSGKKSTS